MTFQIERPDMTGKTPEEAIAALDTWLARLTDLLNYTLNHLDENNLDIEITTKDYVEERIKENYEDIRKYIVQEVNNG